MASVPRRRCATSHPVWGRDAAQRSIWGTHAPASARCPFASSASLDSMSENLCYTDAYLRQTDATVVEADPETHAVLLDRTVFYPGGGGQPPDDGLLTGDSGGSWRVIGAQEARRRHLAHDPRRRRAAGGRHQGRAPSSTGSGGIGSCARTPPSMSCAGSSGATMPHRSPAATWSRCRGAWTSSSRRCRASWSARSRSG